MTLDPKQFVHQRSDSDCYMACLASLTGIPLEEFKVISNEEYEAMSQEDKSNAGTRQHNENLQVLMKHGWTYARGNSDKPPPGWCIGSGKSPRGDWDHSIVCLDGKPFFDPHKSGDMLDGPVTEWIGVTCLEGKKEEQGGLT